jgi:D-3-phosphoglycerate dehydrogenase
MSRPVILRTDAELNMGASALERLERSAAIVTAERDDEATLAGLAPQADIIFTCYAPITARVIDAAPRLRGIVKYGVGVDQIDIAAAARRGVPVVNSPDYGTETVADHAFALLLALARRLTRIDRAMHERGWLWPEPQFSGVDLAGKVLGLVGFGRIGKAMARRAGGFGMKRVVYDPYAPHDAAGWDDLEFAASLDEVLARADFLSLHCVLTPETRGIIGRRELGLLKPSVLLVNVSRGALVDQAALVDALRAGTIAGAGLDVFPEEPLALDHPIFGCESAILTPHFAFYSREAYERLERDCAEKIEALLEGRRPKDVVVEAGLQGMSGR